LPRWWPSGLDVARLNMSHGSQASHHAAYRNGRAAGEASGHSVGVLVDLQGPKIRLGRFAETFVVPEVAHTDDMVRQVDAALQDIGRCDKGDLVVLMAGSPPGTPGRTNALCVHRIGDAIET